LRCRSKEYSDDLPYLVAERLGPLIHAYAEKVRVGTRLTGDAVSTVRTPMGRRVPEQASLKAPAELRKGGSGSFDADTRGDRNP
jgi:hypothetical protein